MLVSTMTVSTGSPVEGSRAATAEQRLASYVGLQVALNIHFLSLPLFLTSSQQTNIKAPLFGARLLST